MPDGIGIGAVALRYWETRQAATANNLANASTPGFKGERVFARLLDDASIQVDSGTDFAPGTVNPTGRPLDVALVGDAFLVVETPAGSRWLRGGSLSLDAKGTLIDPAGQPVLGDQGRIVLPPGQIEITSIGEVLVDGKEHARLRIERPRGGSVSLEREGANLWVPTERAERLTEGEVRVRQGHLEDSNVDPIGALVEMIEIQRAYTAVQRTMITQDEVMQTFTRDIGRVG
jgi:flagellar basal body rod protein FlgG